MGRNRDQYLNGIARASSSETCETGAVPKHPRRNSQPWSVFPLRSVHPMTSLVCGKKRYPCWGKLDEFLTVARSSLRPPPELSVVRR